MKIDRDGLSAEDLIMLRKKLKESMGIKKKIEEEMNREVENKVEDKKQVVNWKILKIVRIMVAYMNPIDGRGKAEVEKAVGKTSKLLDMVVQTNRIIG